MPVANAGPAPVLDHATEGQPAKVRATLALRLRVRWNAAQLDAALADGADPAASRSLALRAQQLADPKHRARIAGSIDRILELTERGGALQLPLTGAPFRPDRIEDARPQLMELAERLETADPPSARGLAMANLLVEDGDGALYAHGSSNPLRPVTEAILAALDH